MLDDALLERALRWLAAHAGEQALLSARKSFEDATGAIREGAPDYESRMAHFCEQYLCEDGPETIAPIARFAAEEPDLRIEERAELGGWLRSHRSLFLFEGQEQAVETGRIRDLLLGGRFRFRMRSNDRQLSPGDHFDGRVVPVGGQLFLGPGRVFHPSEAHPAITALLRGSPAQPSTPRLVLNGLLRMRARYYHFESIRAEHVYRLDALGEPTFAAPWAHRERRGN